MAIGENGPILMRVLSPAAKEQNVDHVLVTAQLPRTMDWIVSSLMEAITEERRKVKHETAMEEVVQV